MLAARRLANLIRAIATLAYVSATRPRREQKRRKSPSQMEQPMDCVVLVDNSNIFIEGQKMFGGDHAPTSAHVDTVPALGAPPVAYTILAVACVTNQSMLGAERRVNNISHLGECGYAEGTAVNPQGRVET